MYNNNHSNINLSKSRLSILSHDIFFKQTFKTRSFVDKWVTFQRTFLSIEYPLYFNKFSITTFLIILIKYIYNITLILVYSFLNSANFIHNFYGYALNNDYILFLKLHKKYFILKQKVSL